MHAEIVEGGQSTIGFGATALLPALGTFNAAIAGSRSDAGVGHLWALGFDRQTAIFNFGARTQRNSDNFRQLGSDPAFPAPRHLTSGNIGITANQYGSVGLAYIRQDISDNSRSELASISYNLQLRRWGNLGITAFKALSGESNRSILINWTIPLGNNLTANLSHAKYGSGSDQSLLQVQRNLPSGEGYGYRLQAADNGPQQASLLLQNNIGTYSLEAASFEGQSSARVGASGGVALLGGSAFLSRRITDSFGLVQVPGMEKIRVYVDNQPAGVTDAKGNALIPRLRPYDNNPVSIEQSDLGMDAEIGSLTMNPVPYYRSGVVIRFPIRRSAGALLRLISKDGQPMPAGAVVELEGQATQFPVAMDGQVYLTGLGRINRLHASWQGKYCTVSVPFEDSVDPLPNLGTLVCEEEHP
ncbi:fimbria/pilus outer membrane usher protein [Undibacterium arcticum]|uniref:fimbria/pilus outer membrane usher protein n=1 Tax=Undibacterium arcticum TaxID=1762892 RepID=UPI003621E566